MIKLIKHKGLRLFFEKGSTGGIMEAHAKKLRIRLAVLHAATTLEDINKVGFRLHKLQGRELKDHHAIDVSGNWRLFFKFEDGDVKLLDYGDYH